MLIGITWWRRRMRLNVAAVAVERYPRVFIAVVFSILLLYVPLYGLYCFGMKTVFGYFADDAFYYLTVAKNSTLGFFTFDGEKPTNGFHPLWQCVLTVVSEMAGRHDSETLLYATFLLGAVLTTMGFVLLGWSLYTITRSTFWPLWLIPGPFYLFFTVKGIGNEVHHGVTYTFCPWSFMNGMESPCSVFAGGLFLYLLTRACYTADQSSPEPERVTGRASCSDACLFVLGLSLALVVMARLDDIFLVAATAMFFLAMDWKGPSPLRRLCLLVFPTAALLTAYLAFNYLSGQSLLPISGQVKSTGGAALSGNVATLLCDFCPPLHGVLRPSYSVHEWSVTAVRSSALVLPMVFALWLTIYLFKSRLSHPRAFRGFLWLLPVLAYIVLKGMYNLVNVRFGSQGYWYHTLPVLMTNWLVILLCWRFAQEQVFQRCSLLRSGCIGLYVLVYLFVSANMIFSGSYANDRCFPIWQHRLEIASALKKIDPNIKLVDRSDGAYGFCLGIPAVCALGYAIDYDGYVALRDGKFLEYCVRRGFTVTFEGRHSYPIQMGDYTLRKIYEHKASGTTFFRIEAPSSNPR
jgi:hypothetical protein